jgi:hypothetical protein
MRKNTRNILMILSIAGLLVIGGIGFAIYKIYTFVSQFDFVHEMPDEIKEAGILKGANFLHKTEMYKIQEQGLLKTIGDVANTKDQEEAQKIIQKRTASAITGFSDVEIIGNEIVAAGNFGAFIFDLNGNLKREISFEPSKEKIKIGKYEQTIDQTNLGELKIAELEKNAMGFYSFSSIQGFAVFDKNGKRIWDYGKENVDVSLLWQNEKEKEKIFQNQKYVLQAAVGDLDNDGFAEYIVSVQNEGIRAFNRAGTEQWFQPEKFPNGTLQIADIEGGGKNGLLEMGAKPKIRDAKGQIVRELKFGPSNGAVLLYENGSRKKSIIVCEIYGNRLRCVDGDQKVFLEGDAPLSDVPKKNPKKITIPGHPEESFTIDREYATSPKAVWVTFRKGQPKYLAVVHAFSGLPRSHFNLYDAKGNLLYHELLPEEAKTIAVIPASNENQQIIIGGKRTIWRYSLN